MNVKKATKQYRSGRPLKRSNTTRAAKMHEDAQFDPRSSVTVQAIEARFAAIDSQTVPVKRR